MSDTINGIIEYSGDKYNYSFSNNVLLMYGIDINDFNDAGNQRVLNYLIETSGSSKVKVDFIEGSILGSEDKIIFITKNISFEYTNHTLKLEIDNYLIIDTHYKDKIKGLTFYCDELNYIYDTHSALKKEEVKIDNVWYNINILNNIATKEFSFEYNKKTIKLKFDINRRLESENRNSPISLKSLISLSFENTNDYEFIYSLVYIVKQFIIFLCNRKNILFSEIILKTYDLENKGVKIGNCFFKYRGFNKERDKIVSKKYVSFQDVDESVASILSEIANDKLYLRHIPMSNEDSNIITPASFIMCVTAFEYEFKRQYDENPTQHKEVKKAARQKLENYLVDFSISNKEEKKLMKKLKETIHFEQLSNKILHFFNKNIELIRNIGNDLYLINNFKFDVNLIADRLSNHRNAFAHGNLEKKFDSESICDIILLRRVVCIMQLQQYSIAEEKIKNIIKKLF